MMRGRRPDRDEERPKKRGRRRAPATLLSVEDISRVDAQVRMMTKNSRAEDNLTVYSSYLNGIHD